MSKNFNCIDYRTARRLAAHGWGIYSRDSGCGIQWATTASARYVRRTMRQFAQETRDLLAGDGQRQPKALTFWAENKRW